MWCFCNWRKMLSSAWCCDIWIVPHGLAVPDILQCISEVSGEKKQKDRKGGCAESQTKVEFMGKWRGEGQRSNRKLRLWTSPVMPQVLVLPVCCLTTTQSAQWLQWELGCWAAVSMGFVCWSCSCGAQVAETRWTSVPVSWHPLPQVHVQEPGVALERKHWSTCDISIAGLGKQGDSVRGRCSDLCSTAQGASPC